MKVDVGWVATGVLVPTLLILLQDEIPKHPQVTLAALAVVGGGAGLVRIWQVRRGEKQRPTGDGEAVTAEAQLQLAARKLASAVERQWRDEARRRGLLDKVMPISWSLDRVPDGLERHDERRLRAWDRQSPSVERLAEFFRQMPSEFLVVLGSRESGKTAAAVLLTLGLLEDRAAQEGQVPVPVLFNLASWDPELELGDWLRERLVDDHPWLRAKMEYGEDASGLLLAEGHVLPILDGLDEVPVDGRGDVIEAIKASDIKALALTCRREEYKAAERDGGAWLHRAVVVKLEAATPQQAIDYLREVENPELRARWDPVFAELKGRPDGPLAAAFSTPFMVSLAHEVFRDPASNRSPDHLLQFDRREEIEADLLAAFVPAVFPAKLKRGSRGRRWRRQDAERWLGFLATEMEGRHETQLRWWDLSTYARPASSILAGLLAFGIAFSAVGLAFTALFDPLVGVIVGGVVALGLAVLSGRNKPPEPSEIQVSITGRLQSALLSGLSIGLIVAVFGTVVRDVGFGLAVGPVFGVPIGILYGLTRPDATARVVDPRLLLRRDRYVALTYGVAYGVPAGIVGWLLSDSIALGVGIGIASALAGGLLYGPIWMLALQGSKVGVVAFGHLAIATLWFAPQKKLPWRVMAFLAHAHHVGVLRQAGGVYQFRHRRLQQALAGLATTAAEEREDVLPGPRIEAAPDDASPAHSA